MKKINKERIEEKFIGACTQCGKLIKENGGYFKDNKYLCESCILLTEQKVNNDFKPPQGIIKFLIYILSVLNPVIGFLFGSIFFSQTSPENRNFGKNCFIFMGIGIFIVFIIFLIIFMLNITFSGKFTDFQFYEGYY